MLIYIIELNDLVDQLEEREASDRRAGSYTKKRRRLSSLSSQLPPAGVPSWAAHSRTQNGTPQGETGVGATARRVIADQL